MDGDFWSFMERLAAESRVVIDRPRGSAHPAFPSCIYPMDYGYLEGTSAIDGGGIDVWPGSLGDHSVEAVALTVDLERRDAEIKVLLGCTEAEKELVLDFLNGYAMRACLVRRDGNFLSMLRSRRTVRHFQPRPVEKRVLERVLEAATWAPSAHNRQPWRFVVLTSPEARERLAQAMGDELRRDRLADGLGESEVEKQVTRSRRCIIKAPAAVMLCLDVADGDSYPDAARQDAERLMGVQSVALAGGHLLLAAHAEGLGAVWMCAPLFAPHAAQKALELPETWQPQALILLGYPSKEPAPRSRRPLEEVTKFL